MDTDRMAQLLTPFLREPPPPELLRALHQYLALLMRWNQRLALTSARDEETVVTRHIGESLFAAAQWFPSAPEEQPRPELQSDLAQSSESTGQSSPQTTERAAGLPFPQTSLPSGTSARSAAEGEYEVRPIVIDVGSGAGFPGIPLKLWAPQIELFLVEAHGKKATFLREVVRALEMTGVTVLNLRAEELAADLAAETRNTSDVNASEVDDEMNTDRNKGVSGGFAHSATLLPPARKKANGPGTADSSYVNKKYRNTIYKSTMGADNARSLTTRSLGATPDWVRSPASLVTLRAVEQFDAILPIAAELVARGAEEQGRVVTENQDGNPLKQSRSRQSGSVQSESGQSGSWQSGRLGLLIGESQVARAKKLLPRCQWDPPVLIPLSTRRVVLTGNAIR
jgi:16S rRNA G527 N7-methylase RsmG